PRPGAAAASPTRWPPRRRTRSGRSPRRRGPRRWPRPAPRRPACWPPRRAPAVVRNGRCRCARSRGLWQSGASRGEHRGREGRRVVVDVQDDHPAFEEVDPALRRPDDRHLEVQETLVLVEDHLALRQLLAVDAPLRGAQLARHVVDLQVFRAGFQAERDLARAGDDAQVRSHIPDPDIGRPFLGQAVPQDLLGRRQADPKRRRQQQQEPAAAAAAAAAGGARLHQTQKRRHLPHFAGEEKKTRKNNLLPTHPFPPLTKKRPPAAPLRGNCQFPVPPPSQPLAAGRLAERER
uniref:Uncharacterized protein n=1 Tax=Naja naja TaxID=35670 RepID=A0A8C6X9T6_NAJNA